MTRLEHAIQIARRVRRNLMRLDRARDLGGDCCFASLLLADALGGPQSLRVTYSASTTHAWNIVDGVILDITATQFNSADRRGQDGDRRRLQQGAGRTDRSHDQASQRGGRLVIAEAVTAPSPAVQRGMELSALPMRDLPHEAFIYAGYLCQRLGMCGEVLLTAYCHYAQIIEGLACEDTLYRVDETFREDWTVAQRDWERVEINDRLRVQRRV